MKSYLSLIPISAKVRKRQNRMTMLCIIISVLLVTMIFSMADMAIRMEKTRVIKEHGNWHIMLKEPSEQQIEQIAQRTDVMTSSRDFMVYTVGEMAKKLDVPASTLRYYDKEGLLPFVERSSGGIRMFRESDFEWLQVIGCMKKAGMSIRDIRQYIELALRGDDTIDTRLKMFTHQRDVLLAQMEEMRHTLETVEYKCWYYKTAKAAGTIDVPRDMADKDVPERFRAIRRELKTIPQE